MGLIDRARPPQIADDGFTAFRARAPWFGGDLQTVRNFLRRPRPDLSPWPAESIDLPMRDGSGDALSGVLHRNSSRRPLVLLIHGLTGCAESFYVLVSAYALLAAGYAVLRLNLRGSGPTRATCRERYHAGRTQDLHDVLAALPAEIMTNGVLAIGYSLGANILLKYLGERGDASAISAAAAVSAPIDLLAAARAMMRPRNHLYHSYLLRRMKEEAFGPRTEYSAEQAQAIAAARTVYAYDDAVVAPLNGFADAPDYYARCSAGAFLDGIAAPTLIIHAFNDPWIPSDAYRRRDWRRNPRLTPLLAPSGGHVGFHASGGRVPWSDRCAAAFFERLVSGAR